MNAVLTGSRIRTFLALCKLKVVSLIVFTAVVGMFLSVPGMVPLDVLVFGSLGIGMAASSAAAINHLLDARADEVMVRTRNRPLPTGQLGRRQVLLFALILAVLSMIILVAFTNSLTAILTFASLIGYAIVYTAWLKRATPQNIVIGGAAGAAPPVLGWVAVTGDIHAHALILFLIIFVWTPPHFWALAIYRRHDYAAADVPMMPVTHGVEFTRWQILFYSIILVLVTLLPWLTGMSGLVYLAGASVLNIGFLGYAIAMLKPRNEQIAMKMFSYSVLYLMMLFAFLLLDHYLPL
ncbi:MAG: protoheme IX farnesyltransferase [Wenzhouxiangella sp.]|nr:protoheme IX farnesyltransferase [Wenzhouxiangella sp.]TVR95162.1 MAG: protoheme IX farnesyltransferase [Wenzhouxiangellaceae bacterium]